MHKLSSMDMGFGHLQKIAINLKGDLQAVTGIAEIPKKI